MKIVALERAALGMDVSFDGLSRYGQVSLYNNVCYEEALPLIGDADIILINKMPIDDNFLNHAMNLKLICVMATGYNNVDLECCRCHNVTVVNVRNYSTITVAQHTFALLLALYDKLPYYDNYVKSKKYVESETFTHLGKQFNDLAGKTYGIVGLGNIGKEVAKLATAFGMKVIYYSSSGNTYDVPYDRVDFDRLLKESDVISIHCPLSEKTKHLFNYEVFYKMKRNSVIINVARGAIIKEGDLVRALNEGLIAGAGLDVFETEPVSDTCLLYDVLDKDKIILTPHTAWGSIESRTRLFEDACLSIESFIEGKPRSVVTS